MTKIAFWAQSLDNVSPDHMEIDQKILEPNHPERQNLVNTISRISLNGKLVLKGKFLSAFVFGSEYVIKTIPQQQDEVNRRSPIICYGLLSERITEGWISEFTEKLLGFTKRIGRSLHTNVKAEIEIGFRRIQNRRDFIKKTTLAALVTLILLIALVIGYAIFTMFIQRK